VEKRKITGVMGLRFFFRLVLLRASVLGAKARRATCFHHIPHLHSLVSGVRILLAAQIINKQKRYGKTPQVTTTCGIEHPRVQHMRHRRPSSHELRER
jgi:hypothetical protein